MPLNAVSLFSGCGGFDWGATQLNINILWANDIDRAACLAYRSILPNVPFFHGDVRDVKDFPNADVLIGCYPCTGFSLAARRRWKDTPARNLMETEGNFLYLEFIRALRCIRPRFFFVENVDGMVSAINGWFFQQQLSGFIESGYVPTPGVLRAVDFGVPQDRKRVFIVGVREDIARYYTYQFPEPTHGPGKAFRHSTLRDAIGHMDQWPEGEFSVLPFHGHYLTRNRKRGWDQPSYTIVSNASHVPLHPMGEPMTFVEKDRWQLNGEYNRRLSWLECRAIQGLPEHLNPKVDLNAKYRVVGNAVPPALATALIRPIAATFNE